MKIESHSEEMIKNMRIASKLASETLVAGMKAAIEGNTTEDIDKAVQDYIVSKDAYPSPIDYCHFPKSVCTSVNEVLCHGIPDNRPLRSGDSVNIDVTCFTHGCHGDNSLMVEIGEVHPDIKRLNQVTRYAMNQAIKICGPGVPYSEIGKTIEKIAKDFGFSVCPFFTGHGIGPEMHMGPYVYHVANKDKAKMNVGNTFTIEPIIML